MPFLHLPVQSGADRVLEAMNRGHTVDDYRRLIDRLRTARPDIALSSDFIVGFPGESDDDFAATLDLVRAIGFAQCYSFKYSKRPGTPGAALRGQIADEVKSARLQALQELIDRQQRGFNEACADRVLPVLFEKPGRHPGQLVGRTPYLQWVHAQAPARCEGRVLPVRITGIGPNSLAGDIETGEIGTKTEVVA
jgi:tRNA-2-methylthio-N6-dimethylallyladenosine synthase